MFGVVVVSWEGLRDGYLGGMNGGKEKEMIE